MIKCRVLGVLDFKDDEEIDYKIIAVPHWSPQDKYNTLKDIESCHLKIYKSFFRIYKVDRASTVKVGDWKNGKSANKIVKAAHERWKTKQNL